jgi:hypothetical protein
VNLFGESRRLYLPFRGLATFAALVLALKYSKDLGVLNRSYLAMIMTSSILCLTVFTSGSTLTLRTHKLSGLNSQLSSSFGSLVLLQGVCGIFFYNVSLLAFSTFKEEIPYQLLIFSNVYFIFSFAHLVTLEILLANDQFKLAGKCEATTVFLQILFYLLGSYVTHLSIASRLLLVFSFSYLAIILFVVVNKNLHVKRFKPIKSPAAFFRLTKHNNSLGTVLGITDRADRILIAWFLPTLNLGQYSAMSSMISFTRFMPDAMSKILVSGRISKQSQKFVNKVSLFIAFILLAIAFVPVSQWVINYWLGAEWLLPGYVSLLFIFQELGRGTFQILQNHEIKHGQAKVSHRASIILLSFSMIGSSLLVLVIKLPGIPLGFTIAYLVAIFYIRRNKVE